MKYIFLAILLVLCGASVLTFRAMPGVSNERPILYWVTDANPAREDQIHLFHLWQVKNGHKVSRAIASAAEAVKFLDEQSRFFRRSIITINPALQTVADGKADTLTYPLTITLPLAEMRLDTANSDVTKRIIQGVSGVGGDVMDMWSGGTMWQMQGMGLLRDVTEDAKKLGFSPAQTYPAVLPEIAMPGENGEWTQYQFPCNVVAAAYIVNLDCFEKVGMPPPPRTWTIEQFETMGREYVKRANVGLTRPKFFFAGTVDRAILRRSFGASELNETLTRCTVDEPRSVRALDKYLQWQDVDRIIPNEVDKASFATDSGYGGQEPQLFNAGNYAMSWTGRYLLIQYRKFNIDRVNAGRSPLKLAVAGAPYEVFPNTVMSTRAAAVYAGGKHAELAVLFQAYLASEDYNMQIVRDADSLPPNPRYTATPEYNRPAPDPAKGIYPETEYGLHQPFEEFAETIAVAGSHSPFILQAVVNREIKRGEDFAINGLKTSAAALSDARRRVDLEIQRNLTENPRMVALYDKKVAQQKQIDQMKLAIEEHFKSSPQQPIPDTLKIPIAMIDNPFHRAFYQKQGWVKP